MRFPITSPIHYSDRTRGNDRTRAVFDCPSMSAQFLVTEGGIDLPSMKSRISIGNQRRGGRRQLDHTCTRAWDHSVPQGMDVGHICQCKAVSYLLFVRQVYLQTCHEKVPLEERFMVFGLG
jgi:hypothetical protein